MWSQLGPGLRINLFLTLLLGIAYPLAVTGVCQVAFPHRANGSLTTVQGKTIGSELIGQSFTKPEYFQPRPSAAGNDGYDATASAGSNYGPTSQKLIDRVKASVEKFHKENPASAQVQAARIAHARGIPADQVRALIARNIEPPQLGVLGEPRVNVLAINLALDQVYPKR